MKPCIYNYDLKVEGENWCVTHWKVCEVAGCPDQENPIGRTNLQKGGAIG